MAKSKYRIKARPPRVYKKLQWSTGDSVVKLTYRPNYYNVRDVTRTFIRLNDKVESKLNFTLESEGTTTADWVLWDLCDVFKIMTKLDNGRKYNPNRPNLQY